MTVLLFSNAEMADEQAQPEEDVASSTTAVRKTGVSIKTSVLDLELEAERLARECSRLDTRCSILTQANADHEKATGALVQKLGDRFQEELKALRDDLDNKMGSHSGEIKTLLSTIASLKEENRALERRCVALEKRSERLEDELLVSKKDEWDEV